MTTKYTLAKIALCFALLLMGASLAKAQTPAIPHKRLPLLFEENRGQSDPAVRYLSHGRNYSLFLTKSGVFFSHTDPKRKRGVNLKMRFVKIGRAHV